MEARALHAHLHLHNPLRPSCAQPMEKSALKGASPVSQVALDQLSRTSALLVPTLRAHHILAMASLQHLAPVSLPLWAQVLLQQWAQALLPQWV